MHYVSTRGGVASMPFEAVLLEGLAEDGGLFLPESWPRLTSSTIAGFRCAEYEAVAERVLSTLMCDGPLRDALQHLCVEAYQDFTHPAKAPLRQISANEWLLELFHGPTLAFKDFALQLLGRMFESELLRQQKRITVIGATSGDTGSAAIRACAGRNNIDVFILFPEGRVSEVQRRQMTTVDAPNVHAIAVEGTFDDCQALVKVLFGDFSFRREVSLAAINSINWVRIAAQIVYYFYAGTRLGERDNPVRFIVPTGNFGDVYAGYAAARMGLPISELVVATNNNDILTRFFETGVYERGEVFATLSPSMDIQVASNFERLLFDLQGCDGALTAQLMRDFAETGSINVGCGRLTQIGPSLQAGSATEAETIGAIRDVYATCGDIVDPHTAVGIAVGRREQRPNAPTVYLATAHPAKFPDAIVKAIGIRPQMPSQIQEIFEAKERYMRLPKSPIELIQHIRAHAKIRSRTH